MCINYEANAFRLAVMLFFQCCLVCACPPDCGSNLSAPGAAGGVFTSPKWPDKYERSLGLLSCSWRVQSSRPDHRVFLHFQSFSIEGEQQSKLVFLFPLSRTFSLFALLLLLLFSLRRLQHADVRQLWSGCGSGSTSHPSNCAERSSETTKRLTSRTATS